MSLVWKSQRYGDGPDPAGRCEAARRYCPRTNVWEHQADRELDNDRIDVFAEKRINAGELVCARGDRAVEPDEVEKERVFARSGENLDLAGGRDLRHLMSGVEPSLRGEPFDHDLVGEHRPERLARVMRSKAVWAVAERSEDEVACMLSPVRTDCLSRNACMTPKRRQAGGGKISDTVARTGGARAADKIAQVGES